MNPAPAPWLDAQPSYGRKLLLMTLTILLMVALVISVVVVFAAALSYTNSRDLMVLLIGLVVLAASIFGLVKLYPYASTPTNFKPTYGVIAPDIDGHPFEVRFQRLYRGRSLSQKGTVRFDQEGMFVEGYLTPLAIVQVGILVMFTLLPLVLFGIGLGFIPALLISYYVGRKKIAQPIPYTAIREMQVKGCKVTLATPDLTPKKMIFSVATSDGERLYRELQQHCSWVFTPAPVPLTDGRPSF